MHEAAVQLRMELWPDDASAASLTREAFSMTRKRRNADAEEMFDHLYPKLRNPWVDRKYLARLEAEMLRQRAALPAASQTCRHCGATGQMIPDPDGRACLACGCVVYK